MEIQRISIGIPKWVEKHVLKYILGSSRLASECAFGFVSNFNAITQTRTDKTDNLSIPIHIRTKRFINCYYC